MHSLLFFDNRKGTIGGQLLESLVLSPRIALRLLKTSEEIDRPNDYLWVFTANDARATPDITSRAVVINLRYEGDTNAPFGDQEVHEESLKRYVRQNRLALLGELFGMVVRWRQADRPRVQPRHRLRCWSGLIGGVLQVAGFPEFLANMDEAAREIDDQMQALEALAGAALKRPGFWSAGAGQAGTAGRPAGDWHAVFRDAGVLQKELTVEDGDHRRSILIGRFFSGSVSKSVVLVDGGAGGEGHPTLPEGSGTDQQLLVRGSLGGREAGARLEPPTPCSGG